MIVFDSVSKTYNGGVEAVCDLSMEVVEGETVILLGTSGSGKTTTLKMVNRLIEPTSGHILIDGTDIMEQDPIQLRRGIGYAIQHIGLFPHMTVAENISVVPKLLKWSRERIAERVDQLLTTVGLDPGGFRDRFPAQLTDPPVILMDEPFGALDPITREQLQDEFIELESEIKKTILFVTHDVFEAVKMGDRIALLDAGKLQQLTAPAELVENPANEFVDNFLGQHRFQLSLLTRTIKTIMPAEPQTLKKSDQRGMGDSPHLADSDSDMMTTSETRLRARSSLIEALNMFKKTNRAALPVYERQRFLGNLEKRQLLNIITHVLGETGANYESTD